MLQTKDIQNKISYKKVSERILLSHPRVKLRELKVLPFLKYYNTLEWESRFTFWLNAAKNIDHIMKKGFK